MDRLPVDFLNDIPALQPCLRGRCKRLDIFDERAVCASRQSELARDIWREIAERNAETWRSAGTCLALALAFVNRQLLHRGRRRLLLSIPVKPDRHLGPGRRAHHHGGELLTIRDGFAV